MCPLRRRCHPLQPARSRGAHGQVPTGTGAAVGFAGGAEGRPDAGDGVATRVARARRADPGARRDPRDEAGIVRPPVAPEQCPRHVGPRGAADRRAARRVPRRPRARLRCRGRCVRRHARPARLRVDLWLSRPAVPVQRPSPARPGRARRMRHQRRFEDHDAGPPPPALVRGALPGHRPSGGDPALGCRRQRVHRQHVGGDLRRQRGPRPARGGRRHPRAGDADGIRPRQRVPQRAVASSWRPA